MVVCTTSVHRASTSAPTRTRTSISQSGAARPSAWTMGAWPSHEDSNLDLQIRSLASFHLDYGKRLPGGTRTRDARG
jgi:hypothetical protein